MPTEAELKLQAKYDAVRKAKEAKALKKKQQADSAAGNPRQQQPLSLGKDVAAAAASAKPAAKPQSKADGKGMKSIKVKLGKPAAAVDDKKPPAAAAPQPQETPRDRALRLLKEQREAKRIAAESTTEKAPVSGSHTGSAPASGYVVPKRQPGREAGNASPGEQQQQQHQQQSPPQEHSSPTEPRHPEEQQQEPRQSQQQKRPALKRPAARQLPPSAVPQPPETAPKRKAPVAPVFAAQETKRPRNDLQESRAHRDAADEARAATLFVGDLPHQWTSQKVEEIFNQFSEVKDARVVGTQCYAFVRFVSPEAARHVMEMSVVTPIQVDGRQLRVNWAQGAMASWKQGSKLVPNVVSGPGAAVIEGLEHPKVREARAAAQAEADAIAPADLAALDLRPPPARTLVAYDDL